MKAVSVRRVCSHVPPVAWLCVLSVVSMVAWLGWAPELWAAPVAETTVPADPTPQGSDWVESFKVIASGRALAVGGRILAAIVLFIIGWAAARMVAYGVYQLFSRTDLDNRLADKLGITMLLRSRESAKESEEAVEKFISAVTFYLLMLLVIVGVLEFAGLSQVAGPIERLVDTVVQALPKIGKALLILIVAYVAGRILSMIVTGALERLGLDRRFAELGGTTERQPVPFSETAGRVVMWLVVLAGLAGSFDALEIEPIAEPMHNAIDSIIGILPDVGVAILLVVAGFFGGRIVRVVLRNVLQSLGFDRLVTKLQLDRVTGATSPSDVVGIAAMVFIVLQATIAALNQVGLHTLSVPLTSMMAQFWNLLPSLSVSILIVVAGVVVGRMLRAVVAGGLRNLGLDRFMESLGFDKFADRDDRMGEYSEVAGFVAQIAVVLVAIAQALANVELVTWSGYVNAFLAYSVQNVLVAILIVGVGFAIGNYVRDVIQARQEDAETGRWMAAFARYAVLVFAFTMGVRQLDIAEDFVLMTFGLLFGALCLAAALAFGLGGRDVAGDIVKRRYDQARNRMSRGGTGAHRPTPPSVGGGAGGPPPSPPPFGGSDD